ncbi:MAG: hypothetical protein ACP5P3_05720 [Ignavibacteria bacterium]
MYRYILPILIIIYFLFPLNGVLPQERISFEKQNKNRYFTSFSFGMGANYGDNKSLREFIEYEIPNYNLLPPSDRLSNFGSGIEFFVMLERQFTRRFSLRGEYTYFIKSVNLPQFPNYDYTYNNHIPMIGINYIIPLEYVYFKITGGVGYCLTSFTMTEYGLKRDYHSTGINSKVEGVINIQISNSFAGYLGLYATESFLGNLKDNDGNFLKSNVTFNNVNLSSFTVGLRLGIEFYFF